MKVRLHLEWSTFHPCDIEVDATIADDVVAIGGSLLPEWFRAPAVRTVDGREVIHWREGWSTSAGHFAEVALTLASRIAVG